MTDESPSLEERLEAVEDRVSALEEEITAAKRTLADSDTASLMLFNGLVSFMVKEGVLDRQAFTSYMQTQVELADLERDHPLVLRFVRGRIDGLMTEELDELHGTNLDGFRQDVLRRRYLNEEPNE